MANEDQLKMVRQGYEIWNAWRKDHLEVAIDLSGADLRDMALVRMNLRQANLRGVNLNGIILVDADLRGADFGQFYFTPADLRGADLRSCMFDENTDLSAILIDDTTCLGDIQWNGADLTVVDWEPLQRLGDELDQKLFPQIAVRAYRQLASQLRSQGMHEYADRFAYRARLCRRKVLRRQRKYGAFLWSAFLDLLAGYGYYPQRSFFIYLFVNLCFAAIYFVLAQTTRHSLTLVTAFVLSITSFHGRGFFPSNITPDDPLIAVAAFQAFVGLIVEASFIATFTERYFGDR